MFRLFLDLYCVIMVQLFCDIVGGEGEVRFDVISAKTIKIESRVRLVVHFDDGIVRSQRLGSLMTGLGDAFETFEKIVIFG